MKQIVSLLFILVAGVRLAAAQTDRDTVRQLPWNEGFETGDAGCWLFVDNDGDGRNWTVGDLMPHSGSYSLLGTYSPHLEDNWAVSLPIALPAEAYGIALTWEVYAHNSYQETYEVLVTTGIRDSLNGYDSIFGETVVGGYHERSVRLDGYRGQVVHIAFRHRSENQNFISIDDVCVAATTAPPPPPAPTVTIDSPDSAKTYDEVTLTARAENADQCTWDIEGATVAEANGQSVTTSWPHAGMYTISVTASGEGGTTTASRQITIYDKAALHEPSTANAPIVYPNPVGDRLNICAEGIQTITLADGLGRIVRRDSPATGADTVSLSLDGLPSGIYTLTVATASGTFSRTVVKQRE